ncbi:TPA: hypothetical protein I9059_000969 [Clostridium perfringens]|nr:hypothetical protein [Clostridium perfringens]
MKETNSIIFNDEEYIKRLRAIEILDTTKNTFDTKIVKMLKSDDYIKIKNKAYVKLRAIIELKEAKDLFFDKHIYNNEKYVTTGEAIEILGVVKYAYDKKISKNINSDNFIKVGNNNYVKLKAIAELKELRDLFWNEHLEIMPLFQNRKYTKSMIESLERVEVPYYATKGNSLVAVRKSELEEKANLKDRDKYMTRSEAMDLLGLTSYTFTEMMKEQGLKYKKFGKQWLCEKEEILFLHEQQSGVGEIYISSYTVNELYGRGIRNKIKSYPLPKFAKRKDVFIDNCVVYYNRLEIEDYLKNRNEIEMFHETESDNDYQTFLDRLNLKLDTLGLDMDIDIMSKHPYTFTKWFEQIKDFLDTSTASKKTKNGKINAYIKATLHIKRYLDEFSAKEIYGLSYNHINFIIDTASSSRNSHEIYKLVRSIASDIEFKLELIKDNNKKFDFTKIKNPLSESDEDDKEKMEKDIYPLSEYKALFKFLNDAQLHISQINSLKTNKEIRVYLSGWLYLILHLNNAWRNGDVVSFPKLYLRDLADNLKINNIKWFNKNKVSLELARRVIARVIQYEFKINKTRMDGHFFCSDTLAPTFATVLLMLDVHIRSGKVLVDLHAEGPVMKFYNKYNEPHRKFLKRFIDCEELKDFEFSSLKMNSSIMTYVYNLGNEMDNLLLPKYMRNHISSTSTLHYVKINKKDMEFLTEQLFERGEFGYIIDTLIDVTTGKHIDVKEKTRSIRGVRDNFGGITKVEATFGLLNSFVNEQDEILNMLLSKGYDGCLKILEDIYMNNMPSKDSSIQCLYSKQECKCPNLEKCIDCKYSIPSIYALHVLCRSFKEDMQSYMSTTNIPSKINLSANLYRKKDLLKRAIEKYGNEYIYSVLDTSRNEFIDAFSSVLQVDELIPSLKGEILC